MKAVPSVAPGWRNRITRRNLRAHRCFALWVIVADPSWGITSVADYGCDSAWACTDRRMVLPMVRELRWKMSDQPKRTPQENPRLCPLWPPTPEWPQQASNVQARKLHLDWNLSISPSIPAGLGLASCRRPYGLIFRAHPTLDRRRFSAGCSRASPLPCLTFSLSVTKETFDSPQTGTCDIRQDSTREADTAAWNYQMWKAM